MPPKPDHLTTPFGECPALKWHKEFALPYLAPVLVLFLVCLVLFHSELVLEKAYLRAQHKTLKSIEGESRKWEVGGFFSGDREVLSSQAMTKTLIKASESFWSNRYACIQGVKGRNDS